MDSSTAAEAQGDRGFAWDAVARIMLSRRAYRRYESMMHHDLQMAIDPESVLFMSCRL